MINILIRMGEDIVGWMCVFVERNKVKDKSFEQWKNEMYSHTHTKWMCNTCRSDH